MTEGEHFKCLISAGLRKRPFHSYRSVNDDHCSRSSRRRTKLS
jgi:hypothetical protein